MLRIKLTYVSEQTKIVRIGREANLTSGLRKREKYVKDIGQSLKEYGGRY